MWQLLGAGGVTLVPIALASVIGLGVALERLYSLRRTRALARDVVEQVWDHVRRGEVSRAREACGQSEAPMARVLVAVLSESGQSRARVRDRLAEAGRAEVGALESSIEPLATIATVTPLLGLLGTVLGMIEAFRLVEEHGFGDPSRFASGIWQALITTAAGLVVAIPAFVTYRHLLTRIDGIARAIESEASALAERVVFDDGGVARDVGPSEP